MAKKEKKVKEETDDRIIQKEEEGGKIEEKLTPEVSAIVKDDDYLRQYQFKKVNDKPTIGGIETDPDTGSKAEKMKKALLEQPRVSIMIPRPEGENLSVTLSVGINGYRLDFPKQTYLSLPEQVAGVIMDSQKQLTAALQPYRVNRDTNTEQALE